jgi:hypothetical protein
LKGYVSTENDRSPSGGRSRVATPVREVARTWSTGRSGWRALGRRRHPAGLAGPGRLPSGCRTGGRFGGGPSVFGGLLEQSRTLDTTRRHRTTCNACAGYTDKGAWGGSVGHHLLDPHSGCRQNMQAANAGQCSFSSTAASVLRGSRRVSGSRWQPFRTGYVPLNYRGNPGVTGVSHGGCSHVGGAAARPPETGRPRPAQGSTASSPQVAAPTRRSPSPAVAALRAPGTPSPAAQPFRISRVTAAVAARAASAASSAPS